MLGKTQFHEQVHSKFESILAAFHLIPLYTCACEGRKMGGHSHHCTCHFYRLSYAQFHLPLTPEKRRLCQLHIICEGPPVEEIYSFPKPCNMRVSFQFLGTFYINNLGSFLGKGTRRLCLAKDSGQHHLGIYCPYGSHKASPPSRTKIPSTVAQLWVHPRKELSHHLALMPILTSEPG